MLHHLFARVMRINKKQFMKDYYLGLLARTPNSTAGYFLTLKLAKQVYDKTLPISCFADWGADLKAMGSMQ